MKLLLPMFTEARNETAERVCHLKVFIAVVFGQMK